MDKGLTCKYYQAERRLAVTSRKARCTTSLYTRKQTLPRKRLPEGPERHSHLVQRGPLPPKRPDLLHAEALEEGQGAGVVRRDLVDAVAVVRHGEPASHPDPFLRPQVSIWHEQKGGGRRRGETRKLG